MGGYSFHYFQNFTETGNTVYQNIEYSEMDGIEPISEQLQLHEDKVFKIDPGSDHIVLMKQANKTPSSYFDSPTQMLYNDANLLKLALDKGKKEEVKIGGNVYPEISTYSGYFDYQYARVYVNDHDSITVKVFIKFPELTNLSLSDADKESGCWYFYIEPGQTIMKRLNFINPFQSVNLGRCSVEHFIVGSTKLDQISLKELMTPEELSTEELIKITKSRGKIHMKLSDKEKIKIISYCYSFDDFSTFVFYNPKTNYNCSAEVFFILQNYRLELSDADSENTWNIELKPNQKLLKKMYKINIKKKASYKFEITPRFTKIEANTTVDSTI